MTTIISELKKRKEIEEDERSAAHPSPLFKEIYAETESVEWEDEPSENIAPNLTLPPLTFSNTPTEEKTDSRKRAAVQETPTLCSAPVAFSPILSTGVSTGVQGPATVQLSADIQELFEKMASTMLILSSSRETETTLFLDSAQFSSSLFYGTRITIREFSTAPKAFNIEIATSPAALDQLNTHKSALLNAFYEGNFNFSIGRLETGIDDRPLFERKDPISQDDDGAEDQKQ